MTPSGPIQPGHALTRNARDSGYVSSDPTPSGTAGQTTPHERWDGRTLLAAIAVAAEDLHGERATIDALNVFPVPDGDTGTNMDLTVSAALAEAAPLADQADTTAAEVAARLARGALLGARGNSGVILSQIFRGIAQGLARRTVIEPRDVARALALASEMAYGAVMKPVEGTMLTVIRGASDGAAAAANGQGATIPDVLAGALAGAETALATTPGLLDVLRQAGVVDAGGQGVVVLIAGLDRFARGASAPAWPAAVPPVALANPVPDGMILDRHAEDYGYCTNFLVDGAGIDVAAARARLMTMGDSAVIVGDATTLKVHIHADNPGRVLDYALSLGELTQIRIDNMGEQTRALRSARETGRSAPSRPEQPARAFGRQAVLAVANGAGLAEALRSMGATSVIDGGATMNPSTEELLAAVEAIDAAEVILLPNHPNVIMAANQVRDLTERSLRIVPTRSVPQGIAALSSFNADADLAANVDAMGTAMAHVHTVQMSTAARDATIDGIAVRAGQAIVLIDGDLAAAADDGRGLLGRTLAEDRFATTELVTIYTGLDVTDDEVTGLAGFVAEILPDANVEIHGGGQALYRFIISLE
jgi:DAK2 domain fusion protein YloV